MHGLYRPHRIEAKYGPTTLVEPDDFMKSQLQRWTGLLASSAGAPVTRALRRRHLPELNSGSRLLVQISSDAATDSNPPGMGGCCASYYWYLAVPEYMLQYLHIVVLEFMATCMSAIIFADLLHPQMRCVLLSDALATPYALTRASEKSELLMHAHQCALQKPTFRRVAAFAEAGHLMGSGNESADSVPTHLAASSRCRSYLARGSCYGPARRMAELSLQ